MHAVRCPHCKRILKMPKALERAKMTCPACKKVFLATTEVVAEPAGGAKPAAVVPAGPGGAAQAGLEGFPFVAPPESRAAMYDLGPEEPPAQAPRAAKHAKPGEMKAEILYRRRPVVWPVVVASVAVVGLIIVLIAFHYYRTHPRVQGRVGGREGEVIYDRRDIDAGHQQELEKLKSQYVRPGEEPPVPAARPETPPSSAGPERGTGSPAVAAPGEPSRPAGPKERPTDANITILGTRVIDGGGLGTSYIVGQIINKYPHPLKGLVLSVHAYNKADKWVVDQPFSLHHVPVGATMKFSVPCGDLSEDNLGHCDVAASQAVPMDEFEVCWEIEAGEVSPTKEESGKIVVTGSAKNPFSSEIEGVKIYCDFFTEEGVFAGSAEGKLEEGAQAIPPGRSRDFRVEFPAGQWLSRLSPQVRVAGRKS